MFTGIIESTGLVKQVKKKGSNLSFLIESSLSTGFKPDQSVAHNGICLTVESIENEAHWVTAVDETLQKTNAGSWEEGETLNLERALATGQRLDGHFVQGHVDTRGLCTDIQNQDGSYVISFRFPGEFAALIIEKGSICVNGISLTAFNVSSSNFSIAVIPYTWKHTNLNQLKKGDEVNLEFDMLGKYILRKLSLEEMKVNT